MSLIHVPKRHFTILPYRLMKRAEYTFEPVLDFYARKFRKMALDHSILEKQRLLIPANRSRKPEDTLVRLKQSHETAGAILPRDEFPELDFVLDQRQGYTIRRVPHYNVQNYYVRIPETGELVRVTINNLEFQPGFSPFFYLYIDSIFLQTKTGYHGSISIDISSADRIFCTSQSRSEGASRTLP